MPVRYDQFIDKIRNRTPYKLWILVIGLQGFCISNFYGQCTSTGPISIPDNDTIVFQLSVSGLTDSNLVSATQGICGIEIDFMHEYLGDLTITLVSPSGTSVTLIGPTTTTTGVTNLVHWDIDFVPCATPASPDVGFTDQWSNAQAWPTIGFYDGTYHPQIGCLENFNSGSANGLWQFIIQDHDQNQLGSIANITLIFCNPDGLECQECNPNAGVLFPASFSLCSGESIQSSSISVDYGGNVPPPLLYQYEYLLVSGNSILQNGTSFSATPAVGNYTICGLNYLLEDSAAINNLLSAGSYSNLLQASTSGSVCAQLTSSCISVQVNNQPDTVVVTGSLCNGELFSYGGQDYFTDGFFYQVHDGPGMCDTIHEIRISDRDLTVLINDPDTLSCGSGAVDIAATVSGATGPFFYQWTTEVGNITSSPTGQAITANQAGQYFLSVSDGLCEGFGSINVHADQGFPQVIVEGGTITCFQPAIDLNPIYVPSDGTIVWTGPSGFTSTQPNITVSAPGTYIMNVTNQSGCSTSKSVDIDIDTMTHPVDIVVIGKDCQNQQITLGNSAVDGFMNWWWTGPNNFFSDYFRPVVTEPGQYSLTITFTNGCQRSANYFFDGDFNIPDIMVSPDDTINCNEELSLSVSSSVPGALFGWTGPHGTSDQPTIQVMQEGTYMASVSAPNGCINSDIVTIERGNDIFDFQLLTDTLNCLKDTVFIGVFSSAADVFLWTNYTGPDPTLSVIPVGAPGVYSIMMTDTNSGCTIMANILVHSDYQSPDFSYLNDIITCANPVAELTFVPFAGFTYSSVYWELPDLSVVQGPILMSALPGEHRLFGMSPNGCTGVRQIIIPFDTIPPFLILESDTLVCEDTVRIISQTLDSVVNYQWSGPGIIVPGQLEIGVNAPGWYHLAAYGLNGCPSEYDIYVDSNFTLPTYQLMADSLRCDRPASLSVSTTDSVLFYAWLNSFGQILSNDSMVQVTQPGLYYFEIRGLNNCPSYDTINMLDLQYPVVTLSADSITCTDSISQISIETDVLQYTVAWLDLNGDTFSLTPSLEVTDEGPYIASVSGENRCPSLDTILIPIDTLHPQAIIEVLGEIRCQMRDVILDASTSSPVPLFYAWTTTGGNLLSDPTLAAVDVRDTGTYRIEVTRLDNGCTDVESIQLMEVPDAITSSELDITPAQCSGDENAAIEITGLQGGVMPILYQINTRPPQSVPFFNDLPPGTYEITVTDAKNCVYDTTVIIMATGPFTVDAGPDQEIYIGETLQLMGLTDLPVDDVQMYTWLNSHDTICTDCLGAEVSPFETTTFTFQVESNTGCVKSDEVIVYVIQKGKYYVANVFSPNGDGINDELRIHPSPGIVKILQWIIFDRWGNAVFGKTDFDPGDPSVFWNGQTSTGEFPNPGVFPYLLEIQLVNGNIELYNGSITLLR